MGIDGTPTIDVRRETMYVVAYSLVGGQPTYKVHALDLSSLNDKPGSPVTVAASHTRTDGSVFPFDATVQRQRSALLLSAGNVYAAFASFCDFSPDRSRGWLLGWNAGTLTPLGANELTDKLVTSPNNFFLSSIWMSGYGVAAEQDGDLFFVTGNSDQNTYNGTTNIQESVVKMRSDLSAVMDLFTPFDVSTLDNFDTDYGSGGVMVVPDQPGPHPKLAVAAGKDGRLFILDRGSLGGFHNPNIPKNVAIGGCWCGPSYYRGSDGVGRVVSSGGFQAKAWKINTALSPALHFEASAPALTVGPQNDGGFFTSVSSKGTSPNTAIIWAIGRPTGADNHVTLFAYNGTASGGALPRLYSSAAGTWPNLGGNANLVPTVANGRVYVPSYAQLQIFGLTGRRAAGSQRISQSISRTSQSAPKMEFSGALYWGTIKSVNGTRIVISLRTGKVLQVDLSEAMKSGQAIIAVAGRRVAVNGSINANGVLEARTMWRAKAPGSWGADRQR